MQKDLKKAEQRAGADTERQKPEDLPLLELRQIEINLCDEKRALEGLKLKMVNDEGLSGLSESSAEIQLEIREAEMTVAIHEKAYAASLADAERLCPGRSPLPLAPGQETRGLDLRARIDDLTTNIENSEQEMKEIKEWIAQVPDDADQAKALARGVILRNEAYNDGCRTQRHACLESLKELAGESSG